MRRKISVVCATIGISVLVILLIIPRGHGQWDPWETPVDLGTNPVTYTYFPIPENEIEWIITIGKVGCPEHALPTDHMYYLGIYGENVPQGTIPGPHEVRAPADGVIRWINWAEGYNLDTGITYDDYMIIILHSNTFMTVLGHVYDLDNHILQQAGELKKGDYGDYQPVWIPVKAGEVIGRATGGDFGAYDKNVTLYFIHPERYERAGTSVFYLHAVNPLDYFEENLKEYLYQKVQRVGEPRGGKIDYDIPGRLIGNWFLEPWKDEHWIRSFGLLSFAPSVYDSSKIMIGFGRGLGVPENLIYNTYDEVEGPDPATVTVESGPVVYHLSVQVWNETLSIWEKIELTILVQMVSEERIKIEAFEGRIENPSFTSNAKYYTR